MELAKGWTDLIRAWTVPTIDPHREGPEHDISFGLRLKMGWVDTFSRYGLPKGMGKEWGVWVGMWSTLAIGLDGTHFNGIRVRERVLSSFTRSNQVG